MVLEKLKQIIGTQLDVDLSVINGNTSIADDLGADSLDIVELMMSVEEEFQITITDEDARTFATVGDVASYIEGKI